MAVLYNYYYIGENPSADGGDGVRSPVLLTFSKMRNGSRGETSVHTHPFMEIFHFIAGNGFFEFGNKKISVSTGDTVVVGAGVKHIQYSETQPLTYYDFSVTGVSLLPECPPDSLNGDGYALIKSGRIKKVSELIDKIKSELDGANTGCYAAANAYVKLFLIDIIRALNPIDYKRKLALPDEVKAYIEAHCDEDIKLDTLCDEFFINKSTLLHTFKAAFGVSPMKYLNFYRIERAKKLLAGGASVTETAGSVGFSNPVYFSEIFRRLTGLSPSAFKKLSAGITDFL